MRNKGTSFEPVEFNESMQPCHIDLMTTPLTAFNVENSAFSTIANDRREQRQLKKHSPMRKQPVNMSARHPPEMSKPQRQRSNTDTMKVDTQEPRFFRLSTYVPFVSSRIFYSRAPKYAEAPRDNRAVLEEMPKPHLTSLVMSAGLISMAIARWVIKPEEGPREGIVELVLDEGID